MLLSEHGQSGLVRDVTLVQLHLELGELLLPPGVEGNLGGGVAAGLLQLLMELIKLPAQLSSALVSAGSGGTLTLQLLVQLFQASLQLLDLSVQFATQSLLILNLSI